MGTRPVEVIINSAKMGGVINKATFRDLLEQCGSLKGMADHYGMSRGTISGMKKKLGA